MRAIAVDRQGKIVARASTPNASDIASENSTWHQWSLDAILQRFADCCHRLSSELSTRQIRGITVTTFGVDGALVDENGELLYPVISWKCPRTAAVMANISRLMTPQQLQDISGVGALDKIVARLRRDGRSVAIVGYNRASADIVDRFALHDKTGVELGTVPR